MRRIRLGRHNQTTAATAPALDVTIDAQLASDLETEAQRIASQIGWTTLTGVTIDAERGSCTAYLMGHDEPVTLAIDNGQIGHAEQVAAVTALTPAGVPTRVVAHGMRITLATSTSEFGVHAITGLPRLR